MKILFAGGVTGGHIAPGIALAEHILAEDKNAQVAFASVANETEQKMIAARGHNLVKVTERNKSSGDIARRLPVAYFRSVNLLMKFKPDAVIGLGGGASLCTCLAAKSLFKPLFLLEQNYIPGRANRLLGKTAARVCCQWSDTAARFGKRGIYTGSPVRNDILNITPEMRTAARNQFCLDQNLTTLLITGGSQGAAAINEVVASCAKTFAGRIQIIHLTGGTTDTAKIRATYKEAGLHAFVADFSNQMHLAYAASDLALSRAGATTISEMQAAGLPAILVPYPFAKDGHQRINARAAVEQKWAMLIEQAELTQERLITVVTTLLDYPARLSAMKQKALESARRDSAASIIEIIRKTTGMMAPAAQMSAAGAG